MSQPEITFETDHVCARDSTSFGANSDLEVSRVHGAVECINVGTHSVKGKHKIDRFVKRYDHILRITCVHVSLGKENLLKWTVLFTNPIPRARNVLVVILCRELGGFRLTTTSMDISTGAGHPICLPDNSVSYILTFEEQHGIVVIALLKSNV